MTEKIVITAHAVAQAEKRLGLSPEELSGRVPQARRVMVWSVGKLVKPLSSQARESRVASAVDKAAAGKGSHRWRQAKKLGDLFERRGGQNDR